MTAVVTTQVTVAAVVAPASAATTVVARPRNPESTPLSVSQRCVVRDRRLGEISGLVETGGALYVVNDTAPVALWRLNHACRATARWVLYPPPAHDRAAVPRRGKRIDTEDLARSADGAFWIADIGGNTGRRRAVSLYRWMPGTSATAVSRYDLRYPDGAYDAEAVLLAPTGHVVIVTKGHRARVYVARGPLRPTNPLIRAGTLTLPALCARCRGRGALVTGGAVASDGRHVVLRTYNSALEWHAPNRDVIGAMVRTRPRVLPLPPSRQGEAIAYGPSGAALLVTTERLPAPVSALTFTR